MKNCFTILILVLWLCFPKLPETGFGPAISTAGTTGPSAEYVDLTLPERIYFAKNKEKKTSDNTAADGAEPAGDGTAKPETSTKEKKVKKDTTPLKPFVPSETVPADQGVDFPYDI
jgi:hypothetical protein